jgi:hypothetical protein
MKKDIKCRVTEYEVNNFRYYNAKLIHLILMQPIGFQIGMKCDMIFVLMPSRHMILSPFTSYKNVICAGEKIL